MRALHRKLRVEHLEELFWRCVVDFDFLHGSMFGADPKEKAYLAPFLAFLLILGLGEVVAHFSDGRPEWFLSQPQYWVLPLQTLVCTVVLARFRSYYAIQPPRRLLFTVGIGVLALIIWIAPQQWLLGWGDALPSQLRSALFWIKVPKEWLGAPRPTDELAFNPYFFGATGWPYLANVGVRFLRLVVIVPLVEEIFWRGFLLRYLINEDFTGVPFGTFSWLSFGIVTVGFCLEHSLPDYPAAILTGMLYNLVAYQTRSLSSCVLTHAVTNALLGIYVLHTGQWGFW